MDRTTSRGNTGTDVKSVEIINVRDNTTRAVTMMTAATLRRRPFFHGPINSRSFANSKTMIVVLGNINPQSACTANVMMPSGAPGMIDTAPARIKMAAKPP